MSSLFEISAQLAIVVDLAVENYCDRPVFVVDGLFTRDEIDDRQSPHAERYAGRRKQTFRVRTTMHHPLTHRMEQLVRALRWRRARIESGPTGNTAHVLICESWRS